MRHRTINPFTQVFDPVVAPFHDPNGGTGTVHQRAAAGAAESINVCYAAPNAG